MREFLCRGIHRGSITLQLVDRDDELMKFGEIGHKAWDTVNGVSTSDEPVTDTDKDNAECEHVSLKVRRSPQFFARVASGADIGFAEAYMAGDFDIDVDDLVRLLCIFIDNRDSRHLSTSSLVLSWLGAWVNKVFHRMNANTLEGSARNISAHYDLSNELFGTFLGETWVYSCGIFETPDSTLDEAQRAKIRYILEDARIEVGHHILEIGCGWGELCITAAREYGCRATGITLSEEQLVLARKRAKEAGVDDRVKFVKADYRTLGDPIMNNGQVELYDRVISVEMLEAVGHEYLPAFFTRVESVCKRDALVVLQVITMPEERYEVYKTTTDFIQKHIFPGGLCPSIEALVSAAASSGGLTVEKMRNIGPHYAKTLREWRRRFAAAVKSGTVGSIGFGDEVFIRKWNYYLAYCEAGFASRTLGTMQMTLSRPGNVAALGKMEYQ